MIHVIQVFTLHEQYATQHPVLSAAENGESRLIACPLIEATLFGLSTEGRGQRGSRGAGRGGCPLGVRCATWRMKSFVVPVARVIITP